MMLNSAELPANHVELDHRKNCDGRLLGKAL